MEVSTLEWGITFAVTIGVLLFDVIVIARHPHEPSLKECATALSVYVGAAVAFGAWVWIYHGHDFGIEFYTGWLVEYSLSVDNLFVFIVLMAALNVPRKYQQEALMVGIILALIFRGIFIAVGYHARSTASSGCSSSSAPSSSTPPCSWCGATAPTRTSTRRTTGSSSSPRDRLNVGEEYRGLKLWWTGQRGPRLLADADRDPGARHDRHPVRAGLDPGDLRHHPGALPGLHRQRVRPDGPAPALLPAGRPAAATGLPLARALASSSPGSA